MKNNSIHQLAAAIFASVLVGSTVLAGPGPQTLPRPEKRDLGKGSATAAVREVSQLSFTSCPKCLVVKYTAGTRND